MSIDATRTTTTTIAETATPRTGAIRAAAISRTTTSPHAASASPLALCPPPNTLRSTDSPFGPPRRLDDRDPKSPPASTTSRIVPRHACPSLACPVARILYRSKTAMRSARARMEISSPRLLVPRPVLQRVLLQATSSHARRTGLPATETRPASGSANDEGNTTSVTGATVPTIAGKIGVRGDPTTAVTLCLCHNHHRRHRLLPLPLLQLLLPFLAPILLHQIQTVVLVSDATRMMTGSDPRESHVHRKAVVTSARAIT